MGEIRLNLRQSKHELKHNLKGENVNIDILNLKNRRVGDGKTRNRSRECLSGHAWEKPKRDKKSKWKYFLAGRRELKRSLIQQGYSSGGIGFFLHRWVYRGLIL